MCVPFLSLILIHGQSEFTQLNHEHRDMKEKLKEERRQTEELRRRQSGLEEERRQTEELRRRQSGLEEERRLQDTRVEQLQKQVSGMKEGRAGGGEGGWV